MATFFASCPIGLSDLVEAELKSFGLKTFEKTVGGVMFDSNWEGCYYANLHSRYSSRILKPLLDFHAYDGDEVYYNIRKHEFTKYVNPDQTVAVDAQIKECKMRDQRFLAMRVKDAIVDQFREKFAERPDVDSKNPDLRIHIKGYKNKFIVSLDTSGQSLFMRGYRSMTGEAPLKENLAAGLIGLSNWDCKKPLVDLFCGSGTILIEAAMMAAKMAPGIHRESFGFMKLKDFKSDVWEKVITEAESKELESIETEIHGFDFDKKVLQFAIQNAKNAGVSKFIKFKNTPISIAQAPTEQAGVVITNPPYGTRIGDEDNLKDVYRDLGYSLKNKFLGWDAWILSGNKDLLSEMKLKSTNKVYLMNGNIECRLLKYEMYAGSKRAPREISKNILNDFQVSAN